MYNCKYCGKEFTNKGNLCKHEKYAHEESAFTHECPHCHRMLTSSGYATHVNRCKQNPCKSLTQCQIEYEQRKSFQNTPGNCRHCNKYCKNQNSLRNHERLCKQNPERQFTKMHSTFWQEEMRSRIDYANPWNKGLTKQTDERVARGCENVKKYYETHEGSFKGKHHCEDTRLQMSNNAKENDFASHFGTSKRITYKGEHFQSTYEVAVAQSLDDYGVRWTKPKRLKYVDPSGKFHYYPADLYLIDYDAYLDPKNDFLIEHVNPHLGYKDTDKIQWVTTQNNVKIFVLNKDQLTWPIIKQLIEQDRG